MLATRVKGWFATSGTGRTPEATVATKPYSNATPQVETTITNGISLVDVYKRQASNDPSSLGAIMFVMSIGIMFGIVTVTFFGKKIQTSMTNFRQKNGAWGALATSCFTMAMIVVFLPVQVFKGPVFLLTMLTSAVITWVHGVVIKKTGWRWLSNFVLADSLILSMAASVLYANLLG